MSSCDLLSDSRSWPEVHAEVHWPSSEAQRTRPFEVAATLNERQVAWLHSAVELAAAAGAAPTDELADCVNDLMPCHSMTKLDGEETKRTLLNGRQNEKTKEE